MGEEEEAAGGCILPFSDLRGEVGADCILLFSDQIGRAHLYTPVTCSHIVCRLLLVKKNDISPSITTC